MSQPSGVQEAPLTVQPRQDFLEAYKEHMVSYISKIYSNVSKYAIKKYVTQIVNERFKDPICVILTYPEHGSIEKYNVKLSAFIRKHKADVITPVGTVFKADLNKIPPSVEYNKQCTASRSYYKKLMFKCMEKGDTFGVDLNDKKQALRKIKNNSIIGGRGFEGNPLYDKESFGAITSLGRNNAMLTYTLTEQFFSNNFYWSSAEKIYNYIIFVSEHTPSIEKFNKVFECCPNLYLPQVEEIVDRLMDSARYYIPREELASIREKCITLVSKLTKYERLYLFYRRNLLNLLKYNDTFMRIFLNDLLTLDQNLLPQATPEDAIKLPSDVSMMLSIIYNHVLQGNAINKDLVKDHPDIAQKFAQIGKSCLNLLEKIEPLMIAFMYTGELVSELTDNKNILRKSVAGSDTDSILFTMKDPVCWYLNVESNLDYKVTHNGICFSAYLVYILSKMLNIANRDLIIAKGSVGNNADEISLKSEFFYTTFIKTDMGKHYVSAYLAKEGRMQKEPKLDIKGVEFQSSTLPQASRDMVEQLIQDTISTIYHTGHISALDLIYRVLDYEKQILKMLQSGNLYYYTNIAIKSHEKEYKDPDRSIWFNYKLWEEVFAPCFGHLALPGKFPILPFKKKVFRSPFYERCIRRYNPDCADRLVKYLSSIPSTKNIMRLPIPIELTKLPDMLIPLVDMRAIIAKNVKPAQLFLKQFGINLGDSSKLPLFLDYYHTREDEVLKEVLKKSKVEE